jgi:5-dehydro-2-deoxygluconokinase
MGRVLLDLYPEQAECALEDVESFRQYAGGFATNVATGLARLGVRTAVFSAVGDDGHGRLIRRFLERQGVDCRWLGTHPTLRTALAFCELWPPDRFPITYHRTPTCPDWELHPEDIDVDAVARVPLLYISGTALAAEPSRSTAGELAAVHWHSANDGHTILDLDWRPMLWDSADDYAREVGRVLPFATTVLGGDSEWAAAGIDPAAPARITRVAKHGPDGCTIYEPDGSSTRVAPRAVDVVNGLGAGDAFAAAWGYGLLFGLEPAELANGAGAIVATRHSCSAAMPTRDELERFLRGESVERVPAA